MKRLEGEPQYTDEGLSALIDAYYIDNPCGGTLHIVLDEGSVEDRSIQFCLGYCMSEGDYVAVAIALELLRRDQEQRDYLINLVPSLRRLRTTQESA